MSDVEWYLESNGVRTGPFSARQIIEKMRTGQVSQDSLVTTPRMQGDWVTVKDLAEAYSELHVKKPATAMPVTAGSMEIAPFTHRPGSSSQPDPAAAFIPLGSTISDDPSSPHHFQAPPRPVEQLEASKLITLHQEEDGTPDPTNSLFQAMQSIREKNNHRTSTPPRDQIGEATREPGRRVTPQMMIIGAVCLLLAVAVYGIDLIRSDKSTVTAEPTKEYEPPPPARPVRPPPAARTAGGLLSDGGRVRTAPPVSRAPVRPVKRPAESYRRQDDDRDRERDRDRDQPVQPAPPEDHFEQVEGAPEEPPDLENRRGLRDPRDPRDPRDAPGQDPRLDPNLSGNPGGRGPEDFPEGVAPEEPPQ